VFAELDRPQIGNIKLLQLPFMVLYTAWGSHTGLGKHRSARSISLGSKNPIGFSDSDLRNKNQKY